jgi:hypothetical protein
MRMIDLRQNTDNGTVVSFEPFKISGSYIICRKTIETQNEIAVEGFYKYDMNTRETTKLVLEENTINYFSPWYYDSDNIYYITSKQKDYKNFIIFNQINLNTESSVTLMTLEISRGQHCQPIEFIDGLILYSIIYDNNFKRISNKQCRTFLFDTNDGKHYEILDKSINSACEIFSFQGIDYLLAKRCTRNKYCYEYACNSCPSQGPHNSSFECSISIISIESFLFQVKSFNPYITGLMTHNAGPNCSLSYLGMNEKSIFYMCKNHTRYSEELLEINKVNLQIITYKLPRSYSHITVNDDRVFIFQENERMVITKDLLNDNLILTYPKSTSKNLRFETFSGFTENKFVFVNGCESKEDSLSYHCKIYDIGTGIGIKHSGKIQSLGEFAILY